MQEIVRFGKIDKKKSGEVIKFQTPTPEGGRLMIRFLNPDYILEEK
jgi:hypothetical protein